MNNENGELEIFFLPFMAHGHMIPITDMAKLFAARGVKTTMITTPLNAPLLSKTIQRTKPVGREINIKVIEFPRPNSGLPPQWCENLDSVPSQDLFMAFFETTSHLREPLEDLLGEHRPSCLVADMFFPWATEAAAKFGIPRLVFYVTSVISLCAWQCLKLYEPHKRVSSDFEPFLIPDLPGEIRLTRMQIPEFVRQNANNYMTQLLEKVIESEFKSYGVVVNTFYELEADYAEHYRKVLGIKAWYLGPVSLCNKDPEEKYHRGKEASINELDCLKWLDSKKPNSVVYVSFGSVAKFTASQLTEIALGLEASGHQFIWVVRRNKEENDKKDWVPEGFEQRVEDKGLIIRDWAPQMLILEHEAVGGFVTHCGWNSTLEAVSSGVPMVTWPISAEQFFNEKLVTQILKIGVGVGVRKWVRFVGDRVESKALEKAVRRVMEGEEAEEMRSRIRRLAQMAKSAVEEGGSSYCELSALIKKLSSLGF
ncbi:UDP-glucuronosyl/UDP-glucosyltransferase [Trema orientale]|uniref:Glycosyltransferase n=1 Tax=Trema orientale TaxID=63057 RepID=A0A2P5E919_TREOI|nr:UDP-glucuronosyl/UDP-glucosyltransferase [Trema orientale]